MALICNKAKKCENREKCIHSKPHSYTKNETPCYKGCAINSNCECVKYVEQKKKTHQFKVGDKVKIKSKSYFVRKYGKHYDKSSVLDITSIMEEYYFGKECTITGIRGTNIVIDTYNWLPEWVTPVKEKKVKEKELYICENAKKCKRLSCKDRKKHEHNMGCNTSCSYDYGIKNSKCIPYYDYGIKNSKCVPYKEEEVKKIEALSLEEQLKKLQDERKALEQKETEVFREKMRVETKITQCEDKIKEEKDKAIEKLYTELERQLEEILDETIFMEECSDEIDYSRSLEAMRDNKEAIIEFLRKL